MRILCTTYFDCSATGTTGHFRVSDIPYTDHAGNNIVDQVTWHRSRNQQRNWETLLQLIGLRCQPQDIEFPKTDCQNWTFSFSVDSPGVYGTPDKFDALYNDCRGVPMVVGLSEKANLDPLITVEGPKQNIWFQTINIQ